MKIVVDETSIVKKQATKFLKIEEKTTLVQLLSNVCVLETHWIANQKTKVLCVGNGCVACKRGVLKRKEYLYYAKINNQEGLLRVPGSVFFDMNAIEDATKRKKQLFIWMIVKQGSGKETRYSVSKHADASSSINLEEGNKKLMEAIAEYEQMLASLYRRLAEEETKDD